MNKLKEWYRLFTCPFRRYTWHVSLSKGNRHYLSKYYVFGIKVAETQDPVQWRNK